MSPASRPRTRPLYRSEQRSLEGAFKELDANIISAVLERRHGNVDLAAQDLLEMKPMKPSSATVSEGREEGSAEKRAKVDWGDVLDGEAR